jgi:hypothetical protein
VLDEKAKDAVKITVIATGFKDSDTRRRQAETRTGFVVSSERRDPDPEPDFEPEAPPMVMEQHEPVGHVAASNPAIAVDTLRDAMIANFEKEDLDVPAFLRKRTEIS